MMFKILPIFCLFLATSQAGLLLGKDGILHKAAKTIGISNLVNVDADARVNVLGNEVGIDGAVGIGESGIGAHASADADVLGQKAKVHADILDGHKIDQHNHEVFKDSANRQYVLERQYIGSQSVLVRKYLDNGQTYVVGANDDDVLQHKQVDESRVYDKEGGWWDLQTKKYYNRLGQWVRGRVWDPKMLPNINYEDESRVYDNFGGWWNVNNRKYYNRMGEWVSDRVWDPRILNRDRYAEREVVVDDRYPTGGWQEDESYIAVDPAHPNHQNEVTGGWQKDGSYIAVDPVHPSHQNEVTGGWQKDGSYIAVDSVHPSHQGQVTGGWPEDGSYIAVDPAHSSHQHEVTGGWQKDGSYIAVDSVHPNQKVEYLKSTNGRLPRSPSANLMRYRQKRETDEVTGGWQKDGSYIAVDPVHVSHQNEVTGGWQKDGSYIAVDPVHPSHQGQITGSWQNDGSYIAVDPVHPSQKVQYLMSAHGREPDSPFDGLLRSRQKMENDEVTGGWQEDGSYIAVDPVHPSLQGQVTGGWQNDGSYIAVDPVHSS